MKARFVAAFAAALFAVFIHSQAEAAGRRVITWVPSWNMPAAMTALQQMYTNVGPGNSISHVALQFWLPTTDGKGVRYTTDGNPTDANVQSFVTWAHAHNIKVLLCVFNLVPNDFSNPSSYSWNWSHAKNAFATNRVVFAKALVAEVKRLGLDGVDIDFEGLDASQTGEHNADRPAYVAFLSALKSRLGNKQLTVDSFPYVYNAPNSSWWRFVLPEVDGLTSMGYQDIGRSGPTAWQRYAWQKNHAGQYANKLQLGVPTDRDTWLGNNSQQQTAWIATDDKVGIALWDARFVGASWQTAPVWRQIRKIKTTP